MNRCQSHMTIAPMFNIQPADPFFLPIARFFSPPAILTLYFVQVLRYDNDQATEAFHLFAMLCYFTPLLGAVIADSFLGKFWTCGRTFSFGIFTTNQFVGQTHLLTSQHRANPQLQISLLRQIPDHSLHFIHLCRRKYSYLLCFSCRFRVRCDPSSMILLENQKLYLLLVFTLILFHSGYLNR